MAGFEVATYGRFCGGHRGVIAEGFDRQWKQRRLFFRKHRGHLPLPRAVDARIGPSQFPLIEIGLRLLKTFETQSFEGCFLRVSDARFPLSLYDRDL